MDISGRSLKIGIAGNPNCGKSALFNAFTGIRQKTGNWPGVTVDRKEGLADLNGQQVVVVDLPGIYSLDASSLDEQVSRDYLLSRDADLIVNVVDASNLERNLYLTVQLLEMKVPIILALNMMDVARKQGVSIDTEQLSTMLGCPVVPIVATKDEGLSDLKAEIQAVASAQKQGGYPLAHDEIVEQAVEALSDLMPDEQQTNRHWLSLELLESDPDKHDLPAAFAETVQQWQHKIENRTEETADIHISGSRYNHAHLLSQNVVTQKGKVGKSVTDTLDKLVLNRWLGVPVFLLVMYLMFMFTINVGGAFIDFFDGVVGAILVDGAGHWLTSIHTPDWLVAILANGIGSGIQVVATFIPVIGALYLFLSFLEDSGYMARAAFVMDRFMRRIGLPGKAFVPLIVGFGCNVPAIMATRTLESERERKLTILMNPFMSCGARLPVYALFAAAFFPHNGQNIVFMLYLIGILAAIITGLIMKKTLLDGSSSGFLMELPVYHMPTLKSLALRTWDRVKLFIKEAGQVIILMVLVLNFLNSIGTDGSFGNEDSEHSVLSAASKQLTPLFAPMGVTENNWPAVVGVFSGVLAKEVVVGTLDNLYSSLATDATDDEQEWDLATALLDAVATVPENLSALSSALLDPLGLDVGDMSSLEAAAEEQDVSSGVFGAMAARFDGQAGAFAYLLFVLMYFPCVATIAVIKREAGTAWAGFVAFWTTSIAYISATLYYQAATFAAHPSSSTITISVTLLFLVAIISGLWIWGKRVDRQKIAASSV